MKTKDNIITILEGYLFNSNRREVIDSEDFNDIAIAIHSEYESQIAELNGEVQRLAVLCQDRNEQISGLRIDLSTFEDMYNKVLADNARMFLKQSPKPLSDGELYNIIPLIYMPYSEVWINGFKACQERNK